MNSTTQQKSGVAALIRAHAIAPAEASILLAFASGFSRESLITHDGSFDADVLGKYSALCARRERGEPIAYLVEEREFYGRRFRITPDVLIPRPETELLVDRALEHLQPGAAVLDLGTGSGVIAITLSCARPDLRATASDISLRALEVARENAKRLDALVTIVQSDWFSAFSCSGPPDVSGRFDLIVSNPPYVRAGDTHLEEGDLRHEPRAALSGGRDGLDAIRRIVADSPPHLLQGGWLMLEHGYDHAEAVRSLMSGAGFASLRSVKDLAGIERVTIGQLFD